MKDLSKRNKIIILALAAGLVIVIMAIAAVINNTTANKVKISGLREALPEGAPVKLIDSIESGAYAQLTLDLDSDKQPTSVSGAIRSVFPFADLDDTHSGSFILDMESVKHSYLVYYSYGGDTEIASGAMGEYRGVLFFCLSNAEDIIYSGSTCSSLGSQDELYLSLPAYEYKLEDGRNVRLSFAPGKEVFATVDHCNATVEKESIIAKAKEWVSGYGFEPTDFKYEVPISYENCLMK